jgi:hypothetical protein
VQSRLRLVRFLLSFLCVGAGLPDGTLDEKSQFG